MKDLWELEGRETPEQMMDYIRTDQTDRGLGMRSGHLRCLRELAPEIQVKGYRYGNNGVSAVTVRSSMYYGMEAKRTYFRHQLTSLKQFLKGLVPPLPDNAGWASFHCLREVRANRKMIREVFLPKYFPELNPSEQVRKEV
jgi:hypothetical protein